MVVAKRQRKEKPVKMDQKKIWGLEWEPQVKQTALLASPIYIGQAQWEETKHKKRSQDWASLFWVSPPSYLEDILSFACQIKLSCHLAVTLVCCFKSLLPWDRTKEITHSTSISGAATQFNLAETTSARPQWGGETEHNRSPTWPKAHVVEAECKENPVQWKWEEAQHPGNWDSKNRLGRKLTQLCIIFQKTFR